MSDLLAILLSVALTAIITGGLVLLVLVTLDRWTARSKWGEG